MVPHDRQDADRALREDEQVDAPVRDLSRGEPGLGREGRLIPETPSTQPEPAGSGLEHLGRRLLIPLALGLLALVGLVLVADARKLAGRLRDFDLALLLPVLGLSLVNYALRRKRVKRGQGTPNASIEEAMDLPAKEANRILDLDAALDRLAALNPRHARIVECRFFAGMTIEETASALDISPATTKRDWTLMRAWLERELGPEA